MEIIGGLKTLQVMFGATSVDGRARPKHCLEAPRPNADSLGVWRHPVAIFGIAPRLFGFPFWAARAPHLCLLHCRIYSTFLSPYTPPHLSLLEVPPASLFPPPDPEHRKGTLQALTQGCTPAGVVFVQVMAECVPAAPHTHHHMVPEDLQGAKVRFRAKWGVSPLSGPACGLPAHTPVPVRVRMQTLPGTRVWLGVSESPP